jgi:hypothetical protein
LSLFIENKKENTIFTYTLIREEKMVSFATVWYYAELGIILLISIGIHEFAHAYSSYKL